MAQLFNIKKICVFSLFVTSALMHAPNRVPKDLRHENVKELKDVKVFKPRRPSQFSRDVVHLLISSMGMNPSEMDVITACLVRFIVDSQEQYEQSVQMWLEDEQSALERKKR